MGQEAQPSRAMFALDGTEYVLVVGLGYAKPMTWRCS